MNYCRKSRMIVVGGYLWSFVGTFVSAIVTVEMHHNLVPRNETRRMVLLVDKDPKTMTELSTWIGFGIAIVTFIAALLIFWGSTVIREQALRYYEESNGFPFGHELLVADYLPGTGIGSVEALLQWPFGIWFVSSLISISYLGQLLEKDETLNTDYRRILCLGAQATNALAAIVHAVVMFIATGDREYIILARVPRRVPRAPDAGQARQNVNDERMRIIASYFRQRSGRQRSADERVRPVQ